MNPLTETELNAIMARALNLVGEELPELVFTPGELEIDWDKAPAPVTVTSPSAPAPARGTRKISIRIPARTLAAFKDRAADTGCRYQTMMLDALQSTLTSWGST